MTHIAADDRLKAMRRAEGNLESHATGEALMQVLKDHHGQNPTGRRVYGRMMGRAVLMAGIAAWVAIGALAACQAILNSFGG